MDYRRGLAWLHRGWGHVDEAREYVEVTRPHPVAQNPFPHQSEAISAWEQGGARSRRSSNGFGQNRAELAIHRVQRSTLVVAPTVDLMAQWYDRLNLEGGPIGLIGGGHQNWKTLRTTQIRPPFTWRNWEPLWIVDEDEVHHLPGPTYSLSAEGMIAPFRLGLTATLNVRTGDMLD